MKLDWFEIPDLDEDDSLKGFSLFEKENGEESELRLFCMLDKEENQSVYDSRYYDYELDEDLMEYYGY